MRHMFGILARMWYDLPKGIIKCTQARDPCIFYLPCVHLNMNAHTHTAHHPISCIRVNRFNYLLHLCRCIMLCVAAAAVVATGRIFHSNRYANISIMRCIF